MYHAHFRGTHYEAGFRWGSLLLKHQNIILENIPFEITQERIDYALSRDFEKVWTTSRFS